MDLQDVTARLFTSWLEGPWVAQPVGSPCRTATSLDTFLEAVEGCRNLVVFTGSGVSATSGDMMEQLIQRTHLFDHTQAVCITSKLHVPN